MMVTPQDVIQLYNRLTSHGIQVWLTGGWGIDALLGVPTRPHKDLDILIRLDDVTPMNSLLAEAGYVLKELWSENQFTVDSRGDTVATAYVLRDGDGRELDVHAFRLDLQGNAIPAWNVEGFIFAPADLSGKGSVDGHPVKCHSAESQMACHTGYPIPDHQWPDLQALHETLGVDFPPEITAQMDRHSAR